MFICLLFLLQFIKAQVLLCVPLMKFQEFLHPQTNKLLTDILKDEQKFKGLVVSDWNSIGDADSARYMQSDESEAALLAIKARG